MWQGRAGSRNRDILISAAGAALPSRVCGARGAAGRGGGEGVGVGPALHIPAAGWRAAGGMYVNGSTTSKAAGRAQTVPNNSSTVKSTSQLDKVRRQSLLLTHLRTWQLPRAPAACAYYTRPCSVLRAPRGGRVGAAIES